MEKIYFRRVDLLLSILPDVMQDPRLALKGGTAINLFVFNMPRLSIDIDLTYLPIEERSITLESIDRIFMEIQMKLSKKGFKVNPKFTSDNHLKQLVVVSQRDLIKIEINSILRGCVYPSVYKNLVQRSVDEFKKSMSIQCLSDNDLFAGKICAALDRQHPRDFYDIYFFLKTKHYTRALHDAFLVYLISSNRPISDLINPHTQDIACLYTNEFKGMTEEAVSLEDLYTAFYKIIDLTFTSITPEDKEFLLSFKTGFPNWKYVPFEHIQNLPAIKWKLYNIQKMDSQKQQALLKKLECKLNG